MDRVIVVDNTGDGALSLPSLACPGEVIHNRSNVGLGAALNQGVTRAAHLGHTHALTLDQDSLLDEGAVGVLLRAFDDRAGGHPVGVAGCNARSRGSGRLDVPIRTAGAFVETQAVVTSGSLMVLEAFERTGPFRADFFIEGIDLEYCLRLRRAGYAVFRSTRPLMTHAAGSGRERKLLGRAVLLSDHPPWRYRLMSRNLVLVLREYSRREPRFAARSIANLAKMMVKVALFEDQAIGKLASVAAGLRDGLLTRTPVL